jgi:hypothetical protein
MSPLNEINVLPTDVQYFRLIFRCASFARGVTISQRNALLLFAGFTFTRKGVQINAWME